MQAVLQTLVSSSALPPIAIKPVLVSLDSGSECSLEHLEAVYRLVEIEDVTIEELEIEKTRWN
jgi:hypothetical protein